MSEFREFREFRTTEAQVTEAVDMRLILFATLCTLSSCVHRARFAFRLFIEHVVRVISDCLLVCFFAQQSMEFDACSERQRVSIKEY